MPNKYKAIGYTLLVPSLLFGVLWIVGIRFELMMPVFSIIAAKGEYFKVIYQDIYNELIGIPLLLSLLLITLSKEKIEDEFILTLRLDSILWSLFVNFILLLVSFIFIYSDAFYNIMVYNMFTLLLIFVGRFNYVLYKYNKSESNEK